jgi:hypothetical protein
MPSPGALAAWSMLNNGSEVSLHAGEQGEEGEVDECEDGQLDCLGPVAVVFATAVDIVVNVAELVGAGVPLSAGVLT